MSLQYLDEVVDQFAFRRFMFMRNAVLAKLTPQERERVRFSDNMHHALNRHINRTVSESRGESWFSR